MKQQGHEITISNSPMVKVEMYQRPLRNKGNKKFLYKPLPHKNVQRKLSTSSWKTKMTKILNLLILQK